MKRPISAVLAVALVSSAAQASQRTASDNVCYAAMAHAARTHGVPEDMLVGIALTETGQTSARGVHEPAPWSANMAGRGYRFDTRREAVAFVEKNLRRGVRSIDVGCMQVNLMWHGNNFKSVNDAFEPARNVDYAASLLRTEFSATGSWQGAIGRYHSYDPDNAAGYRRMVAQNRRPLPPINAEESREVASSGDSLFETEAPDVKAPVHRMNVRALQTAAAVRPVITARAEPALPKAKLVLRREVSLFSNNDLPTQTALLAPAAGPLFARNERRPLYGPLSRSGS